MTKCSFDSRFHLTVLAAATLLAFPCSAGYAAERLWNNHSEINLSRALETTPLEVSVSAAQSALQGWRPGQTLYARAYVERPDGSKLWLRDSRNRRSWRLPLNRDGAGRLNLFPAKDSYTGLTNVMINGKEWRPDAARPNESSYSIEKSIEYRFPDGAGIRVHYMDQVLARYGAAADFPRQVLDAAVLGYQTITQFEGFNTPGYSFAQPDERYAYDPDRMIDVYIGDPAAGAVFAGLGFNARYFKDAPCFDTIDRGDGRYDAAILLPANYSDFIRNWEKINPSSLGRRNIEVDLRGTLVHEMLHVIIFYYNRNLGKNTSGEHETAASKKLDWYVEGLARYFETFVGARHDFFSQGFKQTLPDKIRFSRGGSNYFMRFPDQAFTGLRYENAIFWRYLDHRFGMNAIEKLSRLMRDGGDVPGRLEGATGIPFDALLDEFALSILLKDFGLKEESSHLSDVARTRLLYDGEQFHLMDGFNATLALGKTCRTDWVGGWGSTRSAFGQRAAAGDSTDESDVSAWATDYYEILIDGRMPVLRIAQKGDALRLSVRVVLRTRGGSMIDRMTPLTGQRGHSFDLAKIVRGQGLEPSDVAAVYLLVTNHDSSRSARYEILAA